MSLARNGLRVGLASLLLLAGAKSVHDASAVGDTRTLSFHHTHSGEDLTVTFKRSGRYDEDALKQINHFLRDWRSQDSTTMDRRLFDILWEVYRDVDGKQPIQIISAYRSPSTNAMLRRRSSGVARFSQHMLGHAMDFFIPGVPLEQIRFAGLRLQRGGVGFYPTSGSPFVHLDTGSIRHWPRMSHDQLARVFPDGRTVHVPSDGTPLKGYQLALADIERRGKDGDTGASKPSFFASLFSRKPQPQDDGEDEAGANDADAGTKPTPTAVAAARLADSVPLPRAKPTSAKYQVASAATQPVALKSASDQTPSTESRPQTPADIINARGFWDNDAFASKPATPQQIAALRARSAVTPDPQSTASLPPAVSQAMAYAPASPPLDRSQIVAASAPIPRSLGSALRTTGQATATRDLDQSAPITTATRLTAAKTNDAWVRAMILTPSASNALLATVLGDQDMTLMRAHFVKPDKTVVMGFTDDPQMGVICERFTGSAVAMLATQSFVMRTASLR